MTERVRSSGRNMREEPSCRPGGDRSPSCLCKIMIMMVMIMPMLMVTLSGSPNHKRTGNLTTNGPFHHHLYKRESQSQVIITVTIMPTCMKRIRGPNVPGEEGRGVSKPVTAPGGLPMSTPRAESDDIDIDIDIDIDDIDDIEGFQCQTPELI